MYSIYNNPQKNSETLNPPTALCITSKNIELKKKKKKINGHELLAHE